MLVRRKLLCLFICMSLSLLSSCTWEELDCLIAGQGTSKRVTTVRVPSSKTAYDYDNPSSLWIDSGESVTLSTQLDIHIKGAVNPCATSSRKVLVPAVYCYDGSIPLYSQDRNIFDAGSVCSSAGGAFSSRGFYVDTGLTVNPGDKVKFSLIPRSMLLKNCEALPPGVLMNSNGDLQNANGDNIDIIEACKVGATALVSEQSVAVGPFLNQNIYTDIVNNHSTPYGNKILRGYGGTGWYNGAEFDLRINPDNSALDSVQCNSPGTDFSRYPSYALNLRCNTIYNGSGNFYSQYNTVTNRSVDLGNLQNNEGYAAGLVAKISSNDSRVENSVGEQCFPSGNGGACLNIGNNQDSMRLGHNYAIAQNVESNSRLMLGISDYPGNYVDNIGGYYVDVQTSCIYEGGEGLYMYISSDGRAPNLKPGDSGTYELVSDRAGRYVINTDNPPKAGRIFFGLKNAGTKRLLAEEAVKNEYRVMIQKDIFPVHITALISWLRNSLLDVLYGKAFMQMDDNLMQRLSTIADTNPNYISLESFMDSLRGKDREGIKAAIDTGIIDGNTTANIEFSYSQSDIETGLDRIKIFAKKKGKIKRIFALGKGSTRNYRFNVNGVDSVYVGYDITSQSGESSTVSNLCEISLTGEEGELLDLSSIPSEVFVNVIGNVSSNNISLSCNKSYRNAQSYRADLATLNTEVLADDVFNYFANPREVDSLMDSRVGGVIQGIYNGFLTGGALKAIRALLAVYIAMTAIFFITGMIKLKQMDIALRIFKVTMVVQLMSPYSWEFFNTHLFSLMFQGSHELIAAVGGYLGSGSDFEFLDRIFGILFSIEVWWRILSLFVVPPIGWLIVWVLVYSFWKIVKASFTGIAMYFLSILAVGFLMAVSPIFLSAILFQRTKTLFEGWTKAIINYALQPVFLFAFFSVLVEILMKFLHQLTDFSVCFNCIWELVIIPDLFSVCMLPFLTPMGNTGNGLESMYNLSSIDVGFLGLPFGLITVFLFYYICDLADKFVHVSQSITQALTSSMGGVESGAKKAVGMVESWLGQSRRQIDKRKNKAKGKINNKSRGTPMEIVRKNFQKGDPNDPNNSSRKGGNPALGNNNSPIGGGGIGLSGKGEKGEEDSRTKNLLDAADHISDGENPVTALEEEAKKAEESQREEENRTGDNNTEDTSNPEDNKPDDEGSIGRKV